MLRKRISLVCVKKIYICIWGGKKRIKEKKRKRRGKYPDFGVSASSLDTPGSDRLRGGPVHAAQTPAGGALSAHRSAHCWGWGRAGGPGQGLGRAASSLRQSLPNGLLSAEFLPEGPAVRERGAGSASPTGRSQAGRFEREGENPRRALNRGTLRGAARSPGDRAGRADARWDARPVPPRPVPARSRATSPSEPSRRGGGYPCPRSRATPGAGSSLVPRRSREGLGQLGRARGGVGQAGAPRGSGWHTEGLRRGARLAGPPPRPPGGWPGPGTFPAA